MKKNSPKPKLTTIDAYWKKVFAYFKNSETPFDEATQYAIDVVIHNSYITSKMIIFACKRHLLFLYKLKFEDDFPFFYDENKLNAIIKFASKIIVPEINKPFIFPAFRKFIAGFVFGWVYKNDKSSFITQEVFDVEARKQWKSSFWAMVMLAVSRGLLQDGFPQIFICGPQKDTSKIPYEIAQKYIIKSPKIRKGFEKYNTIQIKSTKKGVIKHLAFEKSALEGKNPSMIILTEYHLHKDDTMQESATSSRNLSRKNQMLIYDTTKGHSVGGVCFSREMDYKTFLQEQIENPFEIHKNYSVFLWAAELDIEDYDNWRDFNLWQKANPGLGISVSLEDLKSEYNKITTNSAETEFKIKRLGMWVGKADAYFNIVDIQNSNDATREIVKPYLDNDFKDLNAVMGIDLAWVNDTSAISLCFEIPQPDGESVLVFKTMGFIQGDNVELREKVDGANYQSWAKNNHIQITPGKVIDFDVIKDVILDWKKKFRVIMIGFDRWQFEIIKQYLIKSNTFYESDLKPVDQGQRLTPFLSNFERKLALKKIHFLDNDYLIDHTLNVMVKQLKNFNDNVLVQKISPNKKIDAFASVLFALAVRGEVDPNYTIGGITII